ncbi:hypothetical protein GMORB2_6183 [Geosmithia morbida]|uniref:Nonselective cation channel n=1 Tax=Geosmithia morbida TaxID=1094350 RepID=A0A9P5D250_9HYPO|nr:uncharacterized protein GMORB2_6183 [Geosmithia morbida]KAF4123482.1 hypothetical protein GMORB2_6183 [Geosmithia morbida]
MSAPPPQRRVVLSTPPDERRPLLNRLYTDHGENGDPIYSCQPDPHSHLPVYTTIHRVRRDIISVVEDYLSLKQLTDVRINVTVVRPLVDKFYELDDISIVYCLLVNRAQFLDEQAHLTNRQNVNWSRATICELIATRILRRFNEDHEGPEGLLLLAHILIASFEPFQNAPADILRAVEGKTSWSYKRTLPSLEVAILTESKHFLSSTSCQKVVSAIYHGHIIYTPSTIWDIIPDHYKLKPITLYEPRDSPLLNQYRLIVPRNRNVLEAIQFAVLLALYVGVMISRHKADLGWWEAMFIIYAFGWGLDQFATILAHGWFVGPSIRLVPSRNANVYSQNLWSFLDVAFIIIYSVYLVARLYGWLGDDWHMAEQSLDVLALGAPVVVPRLAFTILSDNLIFLSLRSMMSDFFALTALTAWCFFGFLLSLLWLGEGAHPTISKWMIYIWFGLDGVGIHRSAEFHPVLGPGIMVTFAFLGNTLFLTILVSMLSNTFSTISSNAVAEMQFRHAVLTLEGVKADAVFAYPPPFNILAVFVFLPLKFVVSPRWFHKIHVATVKVVNFPVLLLIAVAERRLLWPQGMKVAVSPKAFFQRWNLSAQNSLRAVFELPPPDDVADDIAVDDEMTRHLIRRQFMHRSTDPGTESAATRNADAKAKAKAEANASTNVSASASASASASGTASPHPDPKKKLSRRDSTFPGIRQRLRGSFSETEDYENLSDRLNAMKKSMARMEALMAKLVSSREGDGISVEAAGEDERKEEDTAVGSMEESGFAVESSFRGQE